MANASEHSKIEVLQYQLEGFIENLRTIGVIAGDFQQNGQNNFNEKLCVVFVPYFQIQQCVFCYPGMALLIT